MLGQGAARRVGRPRKVPAGWAGEQLQSPSFCTPQVVITALIHDLDAARAADAQPEPADPGSPSFLESPGAAGLDPEPDASGHHLLVVKVSMLAASKSNVSKFVHMQTSLNLP